MCLAVKQVQGMEKRSAPKLGITFTVSTVPLETPCPLQKSLLDSNATLHICNIRDGFRHFFKKQEEEIIYWWELQKIPIQGYGTVEIKAQSMERKEGCQIVLHNVAFAPTFRTSFGIA